MLSNDGELLVRYVTETRGEGEGEGQGEGEEKHDRETKEGDTVGSRCESFHLFFSSPFFIIFLSCF